MAVMDGGVAELPKMSIPAKFGSDEPLRRNAEDLLFAACQRPHIVSCVCSRSRPRRPGSRPLPSSVTRCVLTATKNYQTLPSWTNVHVVTQRSSAQWYSLLVQWLH